MAIYAKIESITVPSSAAAGSTVQVSVTVRNLYSSTIGVYVQGWVGPVANPYEKNLPFGGYMKDVPAGGTKVFSDSFIMPSTDVVLTVNSYYNTAGGLVFDESKTANIAALVNKATIVSKEVSYSGLRVSIPAFGIPQNTSMNICVKARNDSLVAKKLGWSIVVTDPTGSIAFAPTPEYQLGETGAGQIHDEFVARGFTPTKVGEYRIYIALYVYPEHTVVVVGYEGVLCTVIGPRASIVSKVLEYSGLSIALPAPSVPQGASAKIRVGVRNDSLTTQELAVTWTVVDPDGTIAHSYGRTEWGGGWFDWFLTSPGSSQSFVGGSFTLAKVGTYRIRIQAFVGTDLVNPVDDTGDINLCTVVKLPVSASIVSRVLEYSGLSISLPASNVPQGASAKLRVGVRNTSTTGQELSVAWTVVDPDGVAFHSYVRTEWFWTGPGNTQPFVGGTFTLLKVGTYRVRIQAFVKTDLTTPLDDTGDIELCTTVVQTIPTVLHSVFASTTKPTANYGATIPYVLGYTYKGEAQSGTLKVEVGTGVWPTFTPVAVISEAPYNFSKQIAEKSVAENRTFTVPSTLTRGRKYNIRVTLTTADNLTGDHVFYSAFTVLDITVPSTELKVLTLDTSYRDYGLGESLPVSVGYQYKGIAQGGQILIIIGKTTLGIFSQVHAYPSQLLQFNYSDSLVTISESITVTLPKTLDPGQVYSLKVIIETADNKQDAGTKTSAFKIASTEVPDPGVTPYRKVKDYFYPGADDYIGAPASEATAEVNIPMAQLPGTDWISKKVVDEFEKRVAEEGAHMLRLVVYERERGLTSKDYKLIASATKPKDVVGQEYTPQGIVNLAYVAPLWAPAIWAVIVLGILLAIGFIVSAVVPSVREGVWGKDGLIEKAKEAWDLLGDVLPMMVIMMMMALMMEQTREMYEPPGAPPRPKPVTEATVKAAKWSWEKAKELTSRAVEGWREAREADKERKAEELRQAEERERESREKLEEATAELRRRREEQARKGGY